MFCKWCGRKITDIGRPCPACGKNQEPLESGNGFWDLCKEPEQKNTDVPAETLRGGVSQKKDEPIRPPVKRSAAAKFWFGAWAVTFVLLVIAVITLRGGPDHAEDYFPVMQNTEENKQEDKQEDKEPDDIMVMGEDADALLFNAEKLNIESCEIEEAEGKCSFQAGGELLEADNAKLIWQKSSDQGATWVSIAENTNRFVVEAGGTDFYRVICVLSDDTARVAVYVAQAIVPDVNDGQQQETPVDDPTDASGENPGGVTEEATEAEEPSGEPETEADGDPESSVDDGETDQSAADEEFAG